MKAVLNETKRILAVMLSVAMIIAAVPQVAFAAPSDNSAEEPEIQIEEVAPESVSEEASEPQTEPVQEPVEGDSEEDIVQKDAGNEVAEEELASDEAKKDLQTNRVMKCTASGGSSDGDGDIEGTYGIALADSNGDAKYVIEAEAGKGTLTSISTTLMVAKSKAPDADDEIAAATTVAEKKQLMTTTGADLPTGLVLNAPVTTAPGELTVTISGTPKAILEMGMWYMVVSDVGGEDDDWARAEDIIIPIAIEIDGQATTWATDPAANKQAIVGVAGVQFGQARAGYTIDVEKDIDSKEDNVPPVKVIVSTTALTYQEGKTINAEIVEYNKSDNTTELVQSGTASSSAFTVSPAVSPDVLSIGTPVEFSVVPKKSLEAKAAKGTKYRAMLVLTSDAFAKQEIPLEFTVESSLAIDKVTAHGGTEVEGNGTTKAYDLGSFKVGEAINDVVITTKGGSGTISFAEDYTTTCSETGYEADGETMKKLPDGLTGTGSSGAYRISGTIAAKAENNSYIGNTHYFALTVSESGSGSDTGKLYFKYAVEQADVEISMIDGAGDTGRTEFDAGAGGDFHWYGATTTTAKLADEFATVYIKNNSTVNLKFNGGFTLTRGKFVFDPESVKNGDTGLTVAHGSTASFKVVPKELDSTNKDVVGTLTLTAPGVSNTTLNLKYAQNDDITIVEPEAEGDSLGTAYVGEEFEYQFKETHTKGSGATWAVVYLEDHTGDTTNKYAENDDVVTTDTTVSPRARLADQYGLSFNNGLLTGTLTNVDGATNAEDKKLIIKVSLTGTDKDGNAKTIYRTAELKTNKAQSIKLYTGGKEIKTPYNVTMPKTPRDKIADAKLKIDLKNETLVDQEGITATVAAGNVKLDDTPVDDDFFTIVYDENDDVHNASLVSGGLTLDAEDGTGSFFIKANPAKAKNKGLYTFDVEITGPGVETQVLHVSFTVEDAPILNATAVTGFNVDVPATTAQRYTVELPQGSNYDTDGTKAVYSLVSGKLPEGLTLNKKGYFEGTPKEAGKFEITVSATTTTLTPNKTGTYKHELEVTENATLAIALQSDPTTDISGKTYFLPGKITGYKGKSSELTVIIGADAAGEDAADVEVKVDVAEDDRDPEEDLDDSDVYDPIEHPENPYAGSEKVINVSPFTKQKIEKGKTRVLHISTLDGAKAGFYKVRITVKGKNTEEKTLDVAMAVVDPLVISGKSNVSGEIGKPLTELVITSEGGYADQEITWTEAGTNVDAGKKYYVTAAGNAGAASTVTGLKLVSTTGIGIGAPDGIGSTTMLDKTATPIAAGSFPVVVNAEAPALAYAGLSDTYGHVKAYIDRVTVAANQLNLAGDIIPKNTAAPLSFTMAIGKSTKPQITDLEYDTKKASDGDIYGTVTGEHLGKGYLNISRYDFEPVPVGFAAKPLKVTVTGGDYVGAVGNLRAKGTLSDNDNFTITCSEAADAKGYSPLMAAATGTAWTITPNTGLTKGNYPLTLTLEGPNIQTVTLQMTFSVVDRTYTATIDNNIKPDEDDAEKLAERKEYAANISSGDATKSVEPKVFIKGATPAVTDKTVIAIRNTGNTALDAVKVTEAIKSGNKYTKATTPLLTIANGTAPEGGDVQIDCTNGTAIQAKKFGTFSITNKTTTAGDSTAYLAISYKDAATPQVEHNIYVPVSVLILNDAVSGVTVAAGTNTTNTVNMPTVKETYASDDGAVVFTVKNNSNGRQNTLKNVHPVFSGTNADKFEFATIVNGDVEAGKSLNITVRPKQGLPAGTYSAGVAFTADNIAADVEKTITLKVEKSDDFKANKVTTTGQNITDKSIATRLYNSIWFGLTATSDYVIDGNVAGNVHTVFLNLDKNTGDKNDVQIDFTGTAGTGKLTAVESAVIKLHADNSVKTTPTKTIPLVDTEKTAAKTYGIANAAGKKECFNNLTFDLLATVELKADPKNATPDDVVIFDKSVLGLYGTEDLTLYKGTSPAYTTAITSTPDDVEDIGRIVALVPVSHTIGSKFGGSLPSVKVTEGRINKGWIDANNKEVLATTAVVGDMNCTVDADGFVYAANSDKTEAKGIKWTWTKGNTGVHATLTLTDISGKYDEASKIVVTEDSKVVAAGPYPWVTQPVTIKLNEGVPASCMKGSRTEAEAEAKVTVWDYTLTVPDADVRTYKSTYSLEEADDAKGHTWLTPVVTWTDKNSDGKYTKDEVTVTKTCEACGEKIELAIVSVAENMTVQPTCTKEGKATYTVTYTDVDKFEKPAGSVTDTKNVKESVVKALGHKYALEVEWADDHKTTTKATLVCSQCEATETGHSVDVTGSVTYDMKLNEDGTVASNTAIYHAGETDEVRSATWEDDRIAATATFPSKKPSVKTFVAGVPVIEVKVDLTSMKGKAIQTPITLSANVVESNKDVAKKKVTYKATVDLSKYYKPGYQTKYTATEVSNEYTYNLDKNGNPTDEEEKETPAEPEQPENKESKNLFYTQVEKEIITLNLPEGADVSKGTGKWTAFYSVDESSGTVTVKATGKSDLQKAAKDANRVITIPVFGTDDSGASIEVGQFTYSLPVYYQKPTLKLTSTSGKVNTNKDEQTLTTYVTMKKSSGAFEKLDVSEATLKHTGGLTPVAGDDLGEVNFKAKAKASGKLSVQLADWIEPVEVKYNVTESKKDVPTADKKAIIFNSGAYSVTGAELESQTVILKVNGEEPSDENKLTLATMPKGFDASGLKIADGCLNESGELTSSEFTVEYSGTAPAANKTKTYSFKFKTADNVSVTVKVTMSNLSLTNKALPLKVQTKMNLSTGQKMVLIPNFKGVTGNLVVNDLSEADAKNFALEYNEELGQIYLAPAEGATLSTKTQYTPVINTVVGGVPCTTQLKFKPSQSNIKVKIDKVTVPKTKMVDGSMSAEANVLCTYTQGGKTFAIAPNNQEDGEGNVTTKAVTFMLNSKTEAPMVEGTDGWYKIDKSNVLVKYEESTGTILIKPTGKVANGKAGSVKVRLNFNGKTVNQTLTIKVDKKK